MYESCMNFEYKRTLKAIFYWKNLKNIFLKYLKNIFEIFIFLKAKIIFQ